MLLLMLTGKDPCLVLLPLERNLLRAACPSSVVEGQAGRQDQKCEALHCWKATPDLFPEAELVYSQGSSTRKAWETKRPALVTLPTATNTLPFFFATVC